MQYNARAVSKIRIPPPQEREYPEAGDPVLGSSQRSSGWGSAGNGAFGDLPLLFGLLL